MDYCKMNVKNILQDKDKLNRFLKQNKGLVIKVIQKVNPNVLNTYEREDWIQEGMLSLYQAMFKYDEFKGVKFSAFAYIKIKRDLIRKLECNKNRIKFNEKICSLDNFKNQDKDERLSIDYENKLIDKFHLEQIVNNIKFKLTEKQKEVLNYLLKDKSQADIARIMNCSRENIRQIVNSIRKCAKEVIG